MRIVEEIKHNEKMRTMRTVKEMELKSPMRRMQASRTRITRAMNGKKNADNNGNVDSNKDVNHSIQGLQHPTFSSVLAATPVLFF